MSIVDPLRNANRRLLTLLQSVWTFKLTWNVKNLRDSEKNCEDKQILGLYNFMGKVKKKNKALLLLKTKKDDLRTDSVMIQEDSDQ